MHTKSCNQNLPISRAQAWDFFSDPKNLSVITPESMGFVIQSGAHQAIFPGQIIEYTVTPLWGIKVKWVTEITHVVDGHYFVDEQRFGPYSFWHHKHFFREIPGGVAMEDVIHYKIPLGIIGRWMDKIIVKPKLKQIFEYRQNKLNALFGQLD